MNHQKTLELLFPRPNEYEPLSLSILPILAVIAVRFQANDIRDLKALKAMKKDTELNEEDYYQSKHGLLRDRIFCTPTLLTLLGYRKDKSGISRKDFTGLYMKFIEEERVKIKNDSKKSFHKSNTMSRGHLSFLFCLGAFYIKYAFGKKYIDVEAFSGALSYGFSKIQKKYCPVAFTRFFLNGAKSEFFMRDASFKEERELLYAHAGEYLELLGGITGMKKGDRLGRLCAMVVEGMKAEEKKQNSISRERKRAKEVAGSYQLGLY